MSELTCPLLEKSRDEYLIVLSDFMRGYSRDESPASLELQLPLISGMATKSFEDSAAVYLHEALQRVVNAIPETVENTLIKIQPAQGDTDLQEYLKSVLQELKTSWEHTFSDNLRTFSASLISKLQSSLETQSAKTIGIFDTTLNELHEEWAGDCLETKPTVVTTQYSCPKIYSCKPPDALKCDHFIANIKSGVTQDGWYTWAKELLLVLEATGIPVVVGMKPDNYVHPNSSTCAVFFQNGDPIQNRQFYDEIPASRIFWGPFDFSSYAFQPNEDLPFLQGVRVLAEHENQVQACHPLSPVKCLNSPLGVDTMFWQPTTLRQHRHNPILYLKEFDQYIVPEADAISLLHQAGQYSYTVLRTRRGGPWNYQKDQYHAVLDQAPYLVAFTPYDDFANFLHEAMSMDVPVFVVQYATGEPWSLINPQAGMSPVSVTANSTQLLFGTFLNSLVSFHPRDYILDMMSHCSAARKICAAISD